MASGCRVGGGLDFREHVGKRFHAGEIDIKLGASCAAEMGVRVVEAGEDVGVSSGSGEIVHMRLRASEPGDFRSCSDCEHFSAGDGYGFDDLRFVFCESSACVDDAIEEEIVGSDVCGLSRPGVGGGRLLLRNGLGRTRRRR